MATVVELVDNLRPKLSRSHPLPTHPIPTPPDDDFVTAVKYQDEHLVKYWIKVASDQALCDASELVCSKGLTTMARVLYPEIFTRFTYESHAETLTDDIEKHAAVAAKLGHRDIVTLIAGNLDDVYRMAVGACIGGQAVIFDDLLPRLQRTGAGMLLRLVIEQRHVHMYERLTQLVVRAAGPRAIDHVLQSLAAEDRDNYQRWFLRPLSTVEVNQVLGVPAA